MGVLYYVLCFKGYQGVGTREVIDFEPELGKADIIHLMERVPKPFVDEYDLGKAKQVEGGEEDGEKEENGYCTLGLIVRQQDVEKVRGVLRDKDKKEDEDFVLCPVKQSHKELERLVQTWDDVFKLKEAKAKVPR